MKKEDIDLINQHIAKGEFSKVENIIAKLRKRKLSLRDKVSLSDYYDRIGNFEEGFQILGGKNLKVEAKFNGKKEDLPDYLLYLSCLAQKLSNKGSKYSAFKIFNVVSDLKSKAELKVEDALRINLYQTNVYYAYYYYQRAHSNLKEYLELSPSKPSRASFKIHFIRAFILSELGFYEQALSLLETLLHSKLDDYAKALCLIDKGTIFVKINELKLAKENLSEALLLLPDALESIDKVYAYKWLGHLYFLEKNTKEAKSYLANAKLTLDQLGHFPLAKLEILHFQELCDDKSLNAFERLSLYSYFEFHPFKYVNRSFNKNLPRAVFPAWPKDINQKKTHDAFSFLNNTLELVQYQKLPRHFNYPVLDLICQVYQHKKNERIPDLQAKAIYALLSSAGVGLSKWALADYVYAENFVNFELSMIKLNKLVKTISTYFKKIELKNGIYFCEPKSTMLYLIPIDKSECRFQNIVGRIFKNAPEVDELAKFFTTSKPTCYRMRAEVVKR